MTKLNTCIYTHSPLPEDMGDGGLANMILEARFETFPLAAEHKRRMLSTAVQIAWRYTADIESWSRCHLCNDKIK